MWGMNGIPDGGAWGKRKQVIAGRTGGEYMAGIIVAFPKAEDAKNIKNLLVRNGFSVSAVCTTGAQAIGLADSYGKGIVICGYRLPDMIYQELHNCLPPEFQMLLMASRHILAECMGNDIVCLSMPIKVLDLVNTVDMLLQTIQRRQKRVREMPKERSGEEIRLIHEAKYLLMERNHMTEEEAYRYIQKCSMDSGTKMAETAQMVLSMMK